MNSFSSHDLEQSLASCYVNVATEFLWPRRTAPRLSVAIDAGLVSAWMLEKPASVVSFSMFGHVQRRRRLDWLKFFKKIDREKPREKMLPLIADNDAPHKQPAVQ